jgi:hypothetical protein
VLNPGTACATRSRLGRSRLRWRTHQKLPCDNPNRADRCALALAAAARFVSDSALEEAGLEPVVPRDTTKFSRGLMLPCLIPRQRKIRRERQPTSRRRRTLPRYRWFESTFLQRRVRCEPVSRGNSPSYVEKPRFSAGERAGTSGAAGRDAQGAPTSGDRYTKGETMAALAADFSVGEATIWRALHGEGGGKR